jgi:putative spermidine/putrescine transport system permease protein
MHSPLEKVADLADTRAMTGVAASAPAARRRVGPWMAFCAASSIVLVFMIVSPLLVSFWGSFTTLTVMGTGSERGAGWDQVTTSRQEEAAEAKAAGSTQDLGVFTHGARRISGAFTTFWYQYVWEVYGKTMRLSLMLAAISIVTCIVLGVFGGYALVRYSFFGKNLLEELILLPLSLPGIAVAVALIETYGILRGSWLIILFGHLLYTLPFMMQSITNTLRSFDFVTLEMAAASLGASPWQRFRYILLPNLKHAIIVGSLLVFAISLGEFNASFLLNTPINQTFPAALYDSYTNDSFQVSSAATSIFMMCVIPVLLAIQFIGGKEMMEVGGA